MADLLFAPYAERLLACWCAQLAAGASPPARCCFRFDGDTPSMGIAVTEDECKCGTGWVRVVDWFITSDSSFPSPDPSLDAQVCPKLWGLVLEMGIGRCPPIGDQNSLPTCEQTNAFHDVMMDDAQAMRRALYCCFLAVDPDDRISIGSPTRLGPTGACMQQTLEITVMVPACDEC